MNVIFAYNSIETIPAAGLQRVTLDVRVADDSGITVLTNRRSRIDQSTAEMVKYKLLLHIWITPSVMKANLTFFRCFFKAAHRWIAYGNFVDAANVANDSLCKVILTEERVTVSILEASTSGYEFESEKAFTD